MTKRIGWIFALLATFVYSTNAPIARGAILGGMHPMTLLAARFMLATGLYWVAIAGFDIGRSANPKAGSDVEATPRQIDSFGIWMSLGSGLINGLTLVCFFMALQSVSTAIYSMISVTLVQIFTLGLLTLRGEAVTRRSALRLLLGIVGLYFLVGLGGDFDLPGLLLIVSGAFLFALHIASVQWFLKPYDTWIVTTLIVSAAMLSTLLLWVITGMQTFVPWPWGIVAIAFQGIITTFVGRVLTYRAISIVGSGQYALLAPLETMLTLMWAALFLSEWLTGLQWLGAILVLSGVFLASNQK